jgi:hypothetical protein
MLKCTYNNRRASFLTEGRSLIAQFGGESNCFVLTTRALEDKCRESECGFTANNVAWWCMFYGLAEWVFCLNFETSTNVIITSIFRNNDFTRVKIGYHGSYLDMP